MREPVEMDCDAIMRAVNSLPDVRTSRKKEPTPEQKKAILEAWPKSKQKHKIAEIFGVSEGTARRWYEEAQDEAMEGEICNRGF